MNPGYKGFTLYKSSFIVLQVLDANHEYQKMTEIYEEKRAEILCGLAW